MDLRVVELLLLLMMGVFFVWIALIEWRLIKLSRTQRLLFTSQHGIDLEQLLRDFIGRLDRSEAQLKSASSRLGDLEAKEPLAVQHVGIVRFNPFADRGGDQSFVIALLDDRSDGIILSALHARNESRVYAKPVVGGSSTYPLTDEEKEAISRALGRTQRASSAARPAVRPPGA